MVASLFSCHCKEDDTTVRRVLTNVTLSIISRFLSFHCNDCRLRAKYYHMITWSQVHAPDQSHLVHVRYDAHYDRLIAITIASRPHSNIGRQSLLFKDLPSYLKSITSCMTCSHDCIFPL